MSPEKFYCDHLLTFPEIMLGLTQNLGLICPAVNWIQRQTPRQAKYI